MKNYILLKLTRKDQEIHHENVKLFFECLKNQSYDSKILELIDEPFDRLIIHDPPFNNVDNVDILNRIFINLKKSNIPITLCEQSGNNYEIFGCNLKFFAGIYPLSFSHIYEVPTTSAFNNKLVIENSNKFMYFNFLNSGLAVNNFKILGA